MKTYLIEECGEDTYNDIVKADNIKDLLLNIYERYGNGRITKEEFKILLDSKPYFDIKYAMRFFSEIWRICEIKEIIYDGYEELNK